MTEKVEAGIIAASIIGIYAIAIIGYIFGLYNYRKKKNKL